MSKTPKWVELTDGGVRCLRCGKTETMPAPMPVDAFGPWTEYVGAVHRGCQDTGRVDTPATSVFDWIRGHDTGISSKMIYHHMLGIPIPRGDRGNPWDPSDFGRCYRLLRLEPKWRARMIEMAEYSTAWARLVREWDELTAMYGQSLPAVTARASTGRGT